MLRSLISGRPVVTALDFENDIKVTVCITGHREKNVIPFRDNDIYKTITVKTVRRMLCRYIDIASELGYSWFYSGLSTGCDLWAAEYIINKRKSGADIHLIGAIPYLRHAEYFRAADKEILSRVESECDALVLVNTDPDTTYERGGSTAGLYRERNYFMVDRSSAVIAFHNEGLYRSGTGQTVRYAERQEKRIFRFCLEDAYDIIESCSGDIDLIAGSIASIEA